MRCSANLQRPDSRCSCSANPRHPPSTGSSRHHRICRFRTVRSARSAKPRRTRCGDQVVAIGRGEEEFRRARAALAAWRQFDLGWVELFPRQASIEPGTVVAVVIRHLGFWSINGSRVVYTLDDADDRTRFGYAYGTLTNHAESGEELFELFLDAATGDVMYRIRAISWHQAALAWLGQPFVRVLQERFRRDSAAVMRRAAATHRR